MLGHVVVQQPSRDEGMHHGNARELRERQFMKIISLAAEVV